MCNKCATYIFLCLSILLAFSSCKSRKEITKSKAVKSVGAAIIERMTETQLSFQSIEIKGAAKTRMEDSKHNFSIVYRNYSDSLIWVSVRAMLGIEVARLNCTPDEVAFFSRLAGVNERGSWDKITELVGYPLDFYSFQGLMSRRLFYPGGAGLEPLTQFLVNKNSNGSLLVPDLRLDTADANAQVLPFYPFFLVNDVDRSIQRTHLAPANNTWMLSFEYGEGNHADFYGLPDEVQIHAMDADQQILVDFRIQGVSINMNFRTPYPW